ncbi:putative zinc finger protein [Halotydeus destructor]|nr:putative zinc finger protein [Halotydeus destructor]
MKTEKELCHHYSSQHEMRIEKSTCRFSDEIVHVCLPKTSLTLVTESRGSEVPLNHECQYCDDVTLKNVDELVPHYVDAHGKSVEFIEQEVIISMHKFLYCSVCTEQFKNFKELHEHYIASHQLYTFTCKSCHFFTQDSMRLRSHFKAKHLMSSSVQNIQCPYCNGLIQGAERMSKHIISNHCVQTAPNEYSCKSCSQVAGKPLQLYEHSLRCGHHGHSDRDNSDNMTGSSRGNDGQQSETENHANSNAASNGIEMESLSCSLCDMTFTSSEKYELHFNHVHARWVNRNVIHDTFLMVKHASGKTDLVPKPTGENGEERIILSDLPDEKLLQDIGVKTLRGHYCFKCETIIENYCLYYMHMYNVHKMDKMFVCRISSCKQSFKGSQQYLDHIDATGHGQKSVIEDTLVKACHYCDLIFANIDEYQKHLITDEHYVKLQTSEKHNQRPEPRNFKCKTCHTWFGLRDSYIHHMENETHKHYCPYCGLHFALPSSRRIHIQSHHPEKQDICEVCTAKYGTKERLSGHLVEHGILHECKSCTKRFYQCEQLNAHMDCHDDVIDCPWEECSKKLTLSILSSHIRQHRIERNSKCGTCNKVFANQLLLVSHMDVHAKADQNARAILNSVAAEKTRSPAKVDNATTLISITTPKVPTSGSLMSRTNLKRSRIQKSPPMKTEIPEGLRVMCCTCKQHFNSQPELYSHKCNVALAGSTVAQDRPRAQESLTATIIPSESADSVQQATFELNGNQYIININGQSDAELVDSIQSQSSSQQSVNLDMQTTKDKTAFVRKRRPQASRSNSNAQQELQSAVQVVTDTEAQETQEDSQTFVVQQPDGEIFQITIPAGMDANEFLINLYASGDSGVLSADQIIVDTDATQNGDQVSQEDESQTVSHIALENSSSVGQQAANGDQVLYIPSNEGGVTYTLDPEALALLMASSDVPLVVGS